MAFVLRGQCNACEHSRNIWLTEVAGTVPCDHRNRGCRGIYVIVYKGLKKGIPEYLNRRCKCDQPAPLVATVAQEPGRVNGQAGAQTCQHRQGQNIPPMRSRIDAPPVPQQLPELFIKTEHELQELLERPDLQKQLILQTPAVASIAEAFARMSAENDKSASKIAETEAACQSKQDLTRRKRGAEENAIIKIIALQDEIKARANDSDARAEDILGEHLEMSLGHPKMDKEAIAEIRREYLERKKEKHRWMLIHDKIRS